MKQNKYDVASFFEKYSRMERSSRGLAGAGEWPALQRLLPDFGGLRVLDLGCGYGWHCIYAAEHGAQSVLGIDLSEKMLDEARGKTASPAVRYRRAAIEELGFDDGSFDAVISSLALHYIEDYGALARAVWRWLAPNGQFVFSVEHPVFTAHGAQDWCRDAHGDIWHFPVDRYYDEGRRDTVFLGESVVKYHRTLTTYLQELLAAGFLLEAVVEPTPPDDMPDERRRPMMLLVSARKPAQAR